MIEASDHTPFRLALSRGRRVLARRAVEASRDGFDVPGSTVRTPEPAAVVPTRGTRGVTDPGTKPVSARPVTVAFRGADSTPADGPRSAATGRRNRDVSRTVRVH